MTILSARLRSLRESKGLTQQELADIIGVSRAAYYMYESGNNTPRPLTLQKIASCYGVSTQYLLGEELDPVDTLLLKIKNLTDSKHLKWQVFFEFETIGFGGDIEMVDYLLSHTPLKGIDKNESFLTFYMNQFYFLLKIEGAYFFVAATHSGDFVSPPYIIVVSPLEKDLKAVVDSVLRSLEINLREVVQPFLDNLNKLEKANPDAPYAFVKGK